MKRSSDPAACVGNGKESKKPKLSSAQIQQVLDTVATGAPTPSQLPTTSTIYHSPVASRLRPRAPRIPKTKAPRKTKPPAKNRLRTAPPPLTRPPVPPSPPKITPHSSASSSQPPKSTPTTAVTTLPPPPPPILTVTKPLRLFFSPPPIKKSKPSRPLLSTVPSNPTSSVASVSVPPPPKPSAITQALLIQPALPPKSKIPPQTIPPILPPPQSKNQPPPSITPEAASFLLQISHTQFTPSFLQSSPFKASLLAPTTPEYALISAYISNSQPHPFNIDLLSILNITLSTSPSSTPTPSINPPPKNPPKRFCMMLWHGTKPLSVAPILQNGFRCPPTGNQMFGQGIYFADRISKSAKYCVQDVYCTTPKAGEIGYIFLCEVTLGKCYNAKNSNSGYKSAPQITKKDGNVMTFDSLKCTGQNIPERQEQKEIDGDIWPMGKTTLNTKFPSYTVLYNEFIVYNPDMVEIRYLAKVKFS